MNKAVTKGFNQNIQSPARENLSLRSDDIPGAKAKAVVVTKNISHYGNRLNTDMSKYHENLQKHQMFNNHEYIYGGELKVGLEKQLKHGKRHYGDHYRSEIGATDAIKRGDQPDSQMQAFDYPRNLNISDIPGTLVGSSAKFKVQANHDLSQKRRGGSVQRERPEPIGLPPRRVEDSLDRFQQERKENVERSRRNSQAEKFEPRAASLHKEVGANQVVKQEQPKERNPEINIKNVFDSSVLYRDAAGSPTKIVTTDTSFEGGRRKKSLQDYSFSLEKERMGIVTERKEETNRVGDSQSSFRNNPILSERAESGTGLRVRNEAQRIMVADGWKESVLEQAYGKILNKKDDLKKIYTYNIISNQPNPKMLPSNARLPYRYAIPFDVTQLESSAPSKGFQQQKRADTQKIHNLLLEHNNLAREYNQSVPVGREPY